MSGSLRTSLGRIYMSMCRALVKALPRVGQFNDPESEEMLAKFLIDRRAVGFERVPGGNPPRDADNNLTAISR
jgi:hypothetical protein